MIIQCPKCQTKFSVSSELISELELPRFHCSRCDNVFDLDPRTSASFEEQDINKTPSSMFQTSDSIKIQKTKSGEFNIPKSEPVSSNTQDIPPVKDEAIRSSTTLEMSKDELNKVASAFSKAEDSYHAVNAPENLAETITKSIEIPKDFSPTKPVTPPFEKVAAKEEFDTSANIGRAATDLFKKELQKSEQLSMNLKSDSVSAADNAESLPHGISYGEPLSKKAQESDYSDDFSVSNDAPESYLPKKNNWSGVGIFFMPILFTLICSAAFSLFLIKTPNLAEAVVENLGFNLPKFAPAGLYIEKIKFNKIALDNGENIYAISGKIKNNTLKKFKDIILEGFLFDSGGKPISSTKISASSALKDSNLKSMTIDMIDNIQNAKSSRKYELSPNSSQNFIIVLNSESNSKDLAKGEFYSARIHSVVGN